MKQTADDNKKKNYIEKAIALLFIIVLALICLVNFIDKDQEFSEKENRILEQRPELSFGAVETGRFMKQYESYRSDQFAGRDMWVSLKTNIDLLIGRRDSNGIFKGKKKYLLEEIKQPNEQQMKTNIQSIKAFGESYDQIPMYMMLVPNAANIMKDKLPTLASPRDQKADFANIKKGLGSKVTWIDADGALRKHKDEEIYYRTDHHWTSLGAYYAYQKLAETMKLDKAKEPDWKPYAVSNTFNGTLSATSGYEQGHEESVYIYAPKEGAMPEVVVNYVDEQKKTAMLYDPSKLKEKDQYALFLGGNYATVNIRTTAESTERLLVVKDSYANCLIPFLTPYYREIIVVDPRYYYGDITKVMKENKITSVLFLYNGNTFVEDNSISGVLNNNETE